MEGGLEGAEDDEDDEGSVVGSVGGSGGVSGDEEEGGVRGDGDGGGGGEETKEERGGGGGGGGDVEVRRNDVSSCEEWLNGGTSRNADGRKGRRRRRRQRPGGGRRSNLNRRHSGVTRTSLGRHRVVCGGDLEERDAAGGARSSVVTPEYRVSGLGCQNEARGDITMISSHFDDRPTGSRLKKRGPESGRVGPNEDDRRSDPFWIRARKSRSVALFASICVRLVVEKAGAGAKAANDEEGDDKPLLAPEGAKVGMAMAAAMVAAVSCRVGFVFRVSCVADDG